MKHRRLAIKGIRDDTYTGCLDVISRFLSSIDFSVGDFYRDSLEDFILQLDRVSRVALIYLGLKICEQAYHSRLRSIRLRFIIHAISPDAYVNTKHTHSIALSRILAGEGKADVKEGLHCTFNVQT